MSGNFQKLEKKKNVNNKLVEECISLTKKLVKIIIAFSIRPSQNFHPEPHISIVRDKIETVIFGNQHDEVLIATNSGSIKVSKYFIIILIMICKKFKKIIFIDI